MRALQRSSFFLRRDAPTGFSSSEIVRGNEKREEVTQIRNIHVCLSASRCDCPSKWLVMRVSVNSQLAVQIIVYDERTHGDFFRRSFSLVTDSYWPCSRWTTRKAINIMDCKAGEIVDRLRPRRISPASLSIDRRKFACKFLHKRAHVFRREKCSFV